MIHDSTYTTNTSPKLATDQHWYPSENGSLLDRLQRSLNLPALPPIASHILKMCRNEDTDLEKLAALVSQDPAIVARLLHMANSSYYGGTRHTVSNIVQAVTLLGINAVNSLALSFCFYRLCQDINHPEHVGMNHSKFWRRSIIASIAGRTLGHWCKLPDPELAFVAALLQDIGLLALNATAPEAARTLTIDANDNHTQLHRLETQYFGCDHAKMGRWVAESWQLPQTFQFAIGASHHPQSYHGYTAEQQAVIRCVALSGCLADLWCRPDTEAAVKEAAMAAQEWLDLSPDNVLAIVNLIPEGLSEIAGFFQAHIGSTSEIKRPLSIAKTLLSSPITHDTQSEHT